MKLSLQTKRSHLYIYIELGDHFVRYDGNLMKG